MKSLVLAISAAVFLASCAQTPPAPPAPKLKDGEITVPATYKSWPKFLPSVDRADAKQIRDMYINDIGHKTKKGDKFPNGTVSVMELYKAKANADGTLAKDADGRLIKDGLLKVFVMGKGEGWGESAPAGLKNGDWVYGAYMADGKTASPDPAAACRACHLPIGESKDFVARYDEYFDKRK